MKHIAMLIVTLIFFIEAAEGTRHNLIMNARGNLLRPTATHNSRARADYTLTGSSTSLKASSSGNADEDRLLREELSKAEEKDTGAAKPATSLDGKIQQRLTARGERPGIKPGGRTDNGDAGPNLKEEEEKFEQNMRVLAQQAGVELPEEVEIGPELSQEEQLRLQGVYYENMVAFEKQRVAKIEAEEARRANILAKVNSIRKILPKVDATDKLYQLGTQYLTSAETIGCDMDKIRVIRRRLIGNRGNAPQLKQVIMEALRLIEIWARPDVIPLDDIAGPAQPKNYIEMDSSMEKALTQIRRAKERIEQFRRKWDRRILAVAGNERRLPPAYFEILLKETQDLIRDKCVIFRHVTLEEIEVLDIIQLEQIKGKARYYIVIGIVTHGDYLIVPFNYIKGSLPLRLNRNYRLNIKALKLKTPVEIDMESGASRINIPLATRAIDSAA